MRSTRLIDTQYGPMLFSPVLAHSLEPGDLIHSHGSAQYVLSARRGAADGIPPWVELDTVGVAKDGERDELSIYINDPVLRAVGARSAGVIL